MSNRHLPVRPNLDQLRIQAKELLKLAHASDQVAIEEFREHSPSVHNPSKAKLADAQFVLARMYEVASWPRLVVACKMTEAIWQGDVESVRKLVQHDPKLLKEAARGVKDSNWGPPLSYAANVGQDEIIEMLRSMGAEDINHGFDRACLQGKTVTAKKLYEMGARPGPNCMLWTCETQNPAGMQFLLDLGLKFEDRNGDPLPLVALLLETYGRSPNGKHGCLEIAAQQGVLLPDTPTMAMHRGRIDLLARHLEADSGLFSRTFSHVEIFPPELGCHDDHTLALCGTPLEGTTLLHMCVDFDEIEMARWMIERGADVNARAVVDAEGFGGHTALFGCVVSQSYRCSRQKDGEFTRLLLDNGADTTVRASLRKRLRFVKDESWHEYRNVDAVEWGRKFQDQDWVNPVALKMIESR